MLDPHWTIISIYLILSIFRSCFIFVINYNTLLLLFLHKCLRFTLVVYILEVCCASFLTYHLPTLLLSWRCLRKVIDVTICKQRVDSIVTRTLLTCPGAAASRRYCSCWSHHHVCLGSNHGSSYCFHAHGVCSIAVDGAVALHNTRSSHMYRDTSLHQQQLTGLPHIVQHVSNTNDHTFFLYTESQTIISCSLRRIFVKVLQTLIHL